MMLDPDQQLPFDTVLDELFTNPVVPLPLLYRLTDLPEEDFASFKERWNSVDEDRRRVLVRHMVDISEENYLVDYAPVFAFCLADGSPAVRVAALDGLWDTSNIKLVSPIITLLQEDAATEVRVTAAQTLAHYILLAEWGQIPATMTPRIIAALLDEYDNPQTAVSIKRAALEALGAANHPRVPTLIRQAYDSRQHDMQLSAVFAMGSSADERWLPQIMEAMESDSDEIRIEAARAAGSIGSEELLPQLAHLAVDKNLEVALAVVEALGQIGGDTAHRMLVQMSTDQHFARLREAVEEALEEADWLGGSLDMMHFPERRKNDGDWDEEAWEADEWDNEEWDSDDWDDELIDD